MSFKVDMSTQDLDRQLFLLQYYPEFFKKHFRPTLYSLSTRGKQLTLAGVPRRTGKAAGAIRSTVRGTGMRMEGHFGWFGNNQPWYINIVEYGAKRHPVNAGVNVHSSKKRRAIFERFADSGASRQGMGQPVFINGSWITMTIHPGFPKVGFMAAANASIQPVMQAELLRANEAVLSELVVK